MHEMHPIDRPIDEIRQDLATSIESRSKTIADIEAEFVGIRQCQQCLVPTTSGGTNFKTVAEIGQFIKLLENDRTSLIADDLARPNRMCTLTQWQPADPSCVLGKIGHLALFDEPQEALLMSWHLQEHLSTLVVTTRAKAIEISNMSNEQQAVIAVQGSIRPRNWETSPLPHFRSQPGFQINGNPVFARNLLHFSHNIDHCRRIFFALLQDTLVMDTMEDALSYRAVLTALKIKCPTILTRTSRRIHSSGTFGGFENRVPDLHQFLYFGNFGLRPNRNIELITKEIEVLNRLAIEMLRRQMDSDLLRVMFPVYS